MDKNSRMENTHENKKTFNYYCSEQTFIDDDDD